MKNKITIGMLIAVSGSMIVIFGFLQSARLIRYTGYIIGLIGLLLMANKIFDKFKERKLLKEIHKN